MANNPAFATEENFTTSFSNSPDVHQKEENHYESLNEDEKPKSEIAPNFIPGEIPAPYAGMPKEILLHYSRQKKYVWARNILTGLVILTILTLLSMVIALIAVSPACQQFWQTSPIYQIYPKSYYDTDNNGIGDIQGIKEKLGHLSDLGVSTVWLNPVYLSPQVDNGYDVQDYRSIDPTFGTMEDIEDLITELHKEGMKLVMDFVPNHTSNKSEWFLASSDRNHSDHHIYKDYYVWVDGVNGSYPNNWQSVFSNEGEVSAWEWNENRQQYYYHAFFKEQPDLNFRNPAVLQELKDVLTFWLDKGVDGFRVDAIAYMYEATHLRDNPVIDESAPLSYDNVYPDYTENQFGIHDVIAEWRHVLDQYSTEPGVYRFMETEVYDSVDTVVRYYGTSFVKEADFPMNFRLIDLGDGSFWNATNVENTILEWMVKMPEGRWPNWVIGNHDNPRVVSRLGEDKARIATVLTMSLSGTPGMYYGEEIGMIDGVTMEDFRDPERSPMQWDSTANAGFCSNCTPWLPVNQNNGDIINVEAQSDSTDQSTMLCLYKKLIRMRSQVLFTRGSLCILNSTESNVFMFVRELPGSSASTLVAVNFGNTDAVINVKSMYESNLPESATLYFQSSDCSDYNIGVNLRALGIPAQTASMFTFKPPSGSALFSKSEPSPQRCFTASKVCINVLGILEVC